MAIADASVVGDTSVASDASVVTDEAEDFVAEEGGGAHKGSAEPVR